MEENLSVLIVTRSGRLQKALHALLSAVPQVVSIAQTDDVASALQLGAEHPPALVLLNGDLWRDRAPIGLTEIRAQLPDARFLVLADTIAQQRAAENAGADVVLLKGTPASELLATIEAYLGGRVRT